MTDSSKTNLTENVFEQRFKMNEKNDQVLLSLMKAKKEMSSIVKNSKNPFYKNNYADLSTHLEVVEGPLHNHGLIITQQMRISDGVQILITTLTHAESGQFIFTECLLPNPKGDCQGLGGSLTYMRRYSISTLLCLCAEDDDGEKSCIRHDNKKSNVVTQSMPEQKNTSVINNDQLEKIVAMIPFCEKGILENELLPNVRKILMNEKADLSDITPELYERIVSFLQKKIDQKNGGK